MIQGKKREQYVSLEDLLPLTSNGRDIYVKYVGKLSRGAMKRPWGDDNHPSWGVWQAPDGVWMWKDQAKDEAGNPIQFVQKLFNLSYTEATQKICFDLGISDKQIEASKVYERSSSSSPLEKEYAHITCRISKFKPRHHAFWNAVGVSEDWCKKFNCFAVKELAINHKKVAIGEHEIVFVYLADDIDKVKVYFPDRDGGDRFRTNVPFHYLWRHNYLKICDKLVVHKSMKDLITFAQIHPDNIATQNESLSVFNDKVVEDINSISSDVWLFYGSDKDAMDKTKKIIKTTGWQEIHTPTSMLPDVNDVYSYVKQYGLKKLEELCKIKNLL